MMLYVAFAGGLLGFHTYLLGTNITTRELVKRSKCNYLSKVRSNPYSQGLIHNFRTAIYVEESGRYNDTYKDSGLCNLKSNKVKKPRLGTRRFGLMITIHAVENIKYHFFQAITSKYPTIVKQLNPSTECL